MKARIILLFIAIGIVSVSGQTTDSLRAQYTGIRYRVETFRLTKSADYLAAPTEASKQRILDSCIDYVRTTLSDSIFPAWYGTGWDFNGVSRIPGKGEIACGSFVVFTLKDVGFKVPWKMLQQPSEYIIRNIADSKHIKVFANRAKIQTIEKWVKEKGDGIYIAGMDIHVGFLICSKGKVTFCHSSYYSPPLEVVNQELTEKNPFTDAQYRVVGKLTAGATIKKWLLGEECSFKYDYFRK